MTLTVIIVNYNVKYYLEQCLHSLVPALECVDAQVYVVDNNSTDGSIEYLEPLFPGVHFISSLHNIGFAKANNLAIRQTESDYVLLLNPDTLVAENTIRESIEFMNRHPDAGGLGVQMLNADGTKALESRRGLPSPMVAFYKMTGLCRRFPQHPKFGHYYMSNLPWNEPAQIEIISGAYCMLRRTALDKIGLLDESFFMYAEDIDLSCRLLKGGYTNWYIPQRILHYKGESTQKSSFRYVHVFYGAMLTFLKKHYSRKNFLFTIPIKTAIYFKAIVSLFQMLNRRVMISLGFFSPSRHTATTYHFIGEQSTIDHCRIIARNHGLTAYFIKGNNRSMPNGHQDFADQIDTSQPQCVVYDNDAYTNQQILDIFARNPIDNLTMGIYNRQTKRIITINETMN